MPSSSQKQPPSSPDPALHRPLAPTSPPLTPGDADPTQVFPARSAAVTPASTPPLGKIGSCELLEEISRGGMGIVYRARQPALNRVVAVKVILDSSFRESDAAIRFANEAQAAANLKHPNIVSVYEYGESEGKPYLVMEYVPGEHLGSWRSAQKEYDEQTLLKVIRSIALALQHAHEQGVIHRDLKPSNILIDADGNAHLVDFGLAKLIKHDSSLTAAGVVIGTPSYMAPEQAFANAAQIGPATDVYGLGAILYELLTGRPPFRAETFVGTIFQVQTKAPLPPRFLNSAVSRDLEAICLKCLEKDPANRYPTPGAVAAELDRVLQAYVFSHAAGLVELQSQTGTRCWPR